jgi:hypothetical protein
MTRALAAVLSILALAGASVSPARTAAPPPRYWIVLDSDRDGAGRAYSIRPDSSRLTPLLPPTEARVAAAISGDGTTIAYGGSDGIYVSRANGRGLRRVTGNADGPVLSPDGRRVAFWRGYPPHVWVVGADGRGRRQLTSGYDDEPSWSPDGRTIVFHRRLGQNANALVVRPLHGKPHVVVRVARPGGPESPAWSPDGRWIAYQYFFHDDKRNGLWLVRPDGRDRHRVVGGFIWSSSWSPDGSKLAVGTGRGAVALVDVSGRVLRRLRLRGLEQIGGLAWSPDARRLALQTPIDPQPQVWVVGVDGHGLRRLTTGGTNGLVGWTTLAPVRPPAPPLLPSEQVSSATEVATRRPVTDLSADGDRVAFSVAETAADCNHVVVWTPAARRLDRFARPTPCEVGSGAGFLYDVALAGTRVGWTKIEGCGNFCDVTLETATLEERKPTSIASGSFESSGAGYDFGLHGHGDLLVFDDESRLVRIGVGTEQCEERSDYRTRMCTTLRRGDHSALAASVSGDLIAVVEPEAVSILDARGALVRYFPFGRDEVTAAKLDGDRLVVTRRKLIEVYDVSTGAGVLQRPLPDGYELEDVDGGIAVLRHDATVMLLRLADGRSSTLTQGREPVSADLELAGLYYAYATADGGGRVVFMPRAEVLRRLGG